MESKHLHPENLLELIFESAYEGIVFTDDQGIIRYYNEAMERLSGLKKEDVIGKPVTTYTEATRLPIVLRTGKPEIGNICTSWDHGIVNRIPIFDREGKMIGAVGMFLFKEQEELKRLVEKLNALESKIFNYQQKIGTMLCADYNFNDLVGDSEALRKAKELARRAADRESTILLLGESGTGKEMFAHAIHNHSGRRNGPFVKVNCASIPLELIEAELFGYEPGAFTGARNRTKLGKFQMADGGTLFLDEIGDMHHAVQAKVLRVLQDKEVERLGGSRPYKVDVRLIAATNKDLEQAITDGKFRSDLYYRLNVIPIRIPPLRERAGDVKRLVDYFSKVLAETNHESPLSFTPEAMQALNDYHWPGNVREVFNIVTYAHNSSEGKEIERDHLPPILLKNRGDRTEEAPTAGHEGEEFRMTVKESQRRAILAALKKAEGNKTKAARILNLHRSALYKIMDRLEIK